MVSGENYDDWPNRIHAAWMGRISVSLAGYPERTFDAVVAHVVKAASRMETLETL